VIGFVIEAMRTIESCSTSPTATISTSSPRAISAAAPGAAPLSTVDSSRSYSGVIASTDQTGNGKSSRDRSSTGR
jgi:hypothetical protein